MNKKILTILIAVVAVAALTLLVVYVNQNDEREVADKVEDILEAQKDGGLSASGERVKRELIAPLQGESGALFMTADMEIGYLTPPGERIMVFILGNQVEEIEERAINWLLSKGFSEADLCALPVVFSIVSQNPQTEAEYKLETNYIPPYCASE